MPASTVAGSLNARLDAALQPFRRRAVLMDFLRSLMITLPTAAIVAEGFLIRGFLNARIAALLAVTAVAISAAHAMMRRPSTLAMARRIDQRAQLHDLIVTAIGCGSDGMSMAVRDRAVAALTTSARQAAFPIEPPRAWGRWAAVALLTQVVALALVWQAPKERPAAPGGLSSVGLPPGGGAQAPSPNRDRGAAPARPAPSAPTETTATVSAAAASSGVLAPANVSVASSVPLGGPAGDRIRIASANADADITAGRVPASRRAIVERYFATLQSGRKSPR